MIKRGIWTTWQGTCTP